VLLNGTISIYLSLHTIQVLEERWNVIYILYMGIMIFFFFVAIYLSGYMVSGYTCGF